jgi:hypothetical protein
MHPINGHRLHQLPKNCRRRVGRPGVPVSSSLRRHLDRPARRSDPATNQDKDLRIVLRDPVGVQDNLVEHPGQPEQYFDERGNCEQTDRSTNWRRAGGADLRLYDLVEPTAG